MKILEGIPDACLPIIGGILGVGYPILLQTLSGIEEKYSSVKLVELFNKEKAKKLLTISLVAALVSAGLWALNIPPCSLGGYSWLIENSSQWFLLSSTVFLIVVFFVFIHKILIYYSPTKFVQFIGNKLNRDSENVLLLDCLSDLLTYSLRKQNYDLARTLSRYTYNLFNAKRNDNSATEFPDSYYNIVFKFGEQIIWQERNSLKFLESDCIGGGWLLGGADRNISEKTYSYLWLNIKKSVEQRKADLVLTFWKNSHQHFDYVLVPIPYSYAQDYEVQNLGDVEQNNSYKERFLEFHYALGGLFLYQEQLRLIKRIHQYTNSEPPRYVLLPNSIGEIISTYVKFNDRHYERFIWLSRVYSFPEIEGLNADNIIRRQITQYIALLILRQYTLRSYSIGYDSLAINTPPVQKEKRQWLSILNLLEFDLEKHLGNSDVMSCLGYSFITREWCAANHKLYPLELISNLRVRLTEEIDIGEINRTISETKRQQFYDGSNRIVSGVLDKYNSLNTALPLDITAKSFYINGCVHMFSDKETLTDDNEITDLTFDSYLAYRVCDAYNEAFPELLLRYVKREYLLKMNDIIVALQRLNLDENYVVVGLNINGLSIDGFSFEYIDWGRANPHLHGESLYIVKKAELPQIIHRPIEQISIDKFGLAHINPTYNIYAGMLDMNRDNIDPDIMADFNGDNIRKMALLSVFVDTEIKWNENINPIVLRVYSAYRERGFPNKLEDVVPVQN